MRDGKISDVGLQNIGRHGQGRAAADAANEACILKTAHERGAEEPRRAVEDVEDLPGVLPEDRLDQRRKDEKPVKGAKA